MKLLKAALAALCTFTLLATGYLSLSLLILQPPRANFQRWFLMAALFIAQGVLTLIAVAGGVKGAAPGSSSPGSLLALAGAVAIVSVGAWWVNATLASPHFEGYAVVLGSALVVQGLLTLAVFATALARSAPAERALP